MIRAKLLRSAVIQKPIAFQCKARLGPSNVHHKELILNRNRVMHNRLGNPCILQDAQSQFF
jgi:hypothetical protein